MSEELSIRVLNIGYDFIKEWKETKKMTLEERLERMKARYIKKNYGIIKNLEACQFFSEEYFEKAVKNDQYEKRIQKMIELTETLPYTINKLASRAIKTVKLRNLNLNTILIAGTFNFDGATIPYKKYGGWSLD